jgi:hypothetical protein
MADGKHPPLIGGQANQLATMLDAKCHGLFDEDVLAGHQCRGSDFGVQGIGNDNRDRVDVGPLEQLVVVGVNGGPGMSGNRGGAARLRRDGNRYQFRAGCGGKCPGMMSAEQAVTDDAAANQVVIGVPSPWSRDPATRATRPQ